MLLIAKRSSQHITSHRTAPAHHVRPRMCMCTAPPVQPAAPRLASATARLGEASERMRAWFTDLLLPASQVVYTKSTL